MKEQREYLLEIVLTLIGWYFVLFGMKPFIQQQDLTLHFGNAILAFLLLLGSGLIISYFVALFMKNDKVDDKKRKQMGILTGLIGGTLLLLSVVSVFITPFGQAFELSHYTLFGVGCFFLLASYLLKKMRMASSKDNRKL